MASPRLAIGQLWPFIDSYWLGALGLFALLPDKVVQEDVLIRRMQEFGESLYFSGMMGACPCFFSVLGK
jgi:hypothetical protein